MRINRGSKTKLDDEEKNLRVLAVAQVKSIPTVEGRSQNRLALVTHTSAWHSSAYLGQALRDGKQTYRVARPAGLDSLFS